MDLFISFSLAHVNLRIVNTCTAAARRPGAKFTPRKDESEGSVWKLASLGTNILSVLRFSGKAAVERMRSTLKPRALKPEERLSLVQLLGLVDLTLQSLHLGLRRREGRISLRLAHRGRGRCRGRSGGRRGGEPAQGQGQRQEEPAQGQGPAQGQ